MTSSSFHEHKVKLRKEHLPFDVEGWYEWLGPQHTFATHFFDISLGEAKALLAWYHHRYNSRSAPVREDVMQLMQLRDRLEPTLGQPNKDWFIRLSSRSPKDAGSLNRDEYETELAKWRQALLGDAPSDSVRDAGSLLSDMPKGGSASEEGRRLLEANAKMLAFSQVTWANQKTKGGPGTGTGVLEHLVSSERVLVDLIEATEAEELFTMKIIAREWEQDVRHDYEFRGFVHNGQLTALSQYNHYCFFPHVLSEKAELEQSIREYWNASVKGLIKLDSYIVDFAVLSSGRVLVVELNPFKTTTGACLFSWAHHREVLENGPFEFRVHPSTPPELTGFVEHAIPEAFRQAEADRSLPGLDDLIAIHELNKAERSCLIL